jgi:hypothetical protein
MTASAPQSSHCTLWAPHRPDTCNCPVLSCLFGKEQGAGYVFFFSHPLTWRLQGAQEMLEKQVTAPRCAHLGGKVTTGRDCQGCSFPVTTNKCLLFLQWEWCFLRERAAAESQCGQWRGASPRQAGIPRAVPAVTGSPGQGEVCHQQQVSWGETPEHMPMCQGPQCISIVT